MPRGGARPGAGRKKGSKPERKETPVAIVRDFGSDARRYTDKVLMAFVRILDDKKAPPAAVVAAGNSILERAYGKARQSVDVKQGGTVRVRVHFVKA